MNHRSALTTPETYVGVIAAWYVILLSLGIPKLPGWAHVAGAIAFVGAVAGVAVSALVRDPAASKQTLYRLGGLFLAGVIVASAVTATTPLSIKAFMKSTLIGKLVIAVVGACLFGGVVVGLVTAARETLRRLSVGETVQSLR